MKKGSRSTRGSRRSRGITHTVIKGPLEKWWDGVKRKWEPRIVKAFAFVGAIIVIAVAIKEIL